MQMIATNVRHPRDFRGDLAAMIGSAHVGERRFLALANEFGWETTHEAIEAVLDGAERQTRAVIAAMAGRRLFRARRCSTMTAAATSDIHIRATVTKSGSDLTIDLTDSHPQVTSFINSSYPNMYSSVVVALAYLIDPDTPKNDGTFRPLSYRQAGHGRLGQSRRAGDAGDQPLRAGDHRGDHQGAGAGLPGARHGRLGPPLPHRDPGQRPAPPHRRRSGGRPFIWHFFQARPGGGASSAGDGWPGAGEWQAAGGIKFGSLEVTEVRFPLFFKTPRVPPGFRRRRALSRRPRRRRRDGRRDRRAGDRQHRRRRRQIRRLRHPRRRGRPAAPLPALFRQARRRARSRPRRPAS